MNISIDQLRSFVAIINERSFTKAAKATHITQAAISMQIKRLEESVQKKLFYRSKSSINLTSDGDILAEYARKILKLYDEAQVALEKPPLDSLVKVGLPDDYSCFLGEVLKRLSLSHPLIRVELICKPTEELHKLMASKKIDISITTRGCGSPLSNGRVVIIEPLVWVASNKHAVELKNPLPLAVHDNSGPFQQQGINALQKLGRDCRITYSSPSITGLISAIESGLAVGLIAKVNAPSDSRILKLKDGFPLMPSMELEIRSNQGEAVKILTQYFIEVLENN